MVLGDELVRLDPKGVFNFSPQIPSVIDVVVWWAYLVPVMFLFVPWSRQGSRRGRSTVAPPSRPTHRREPAVGTHSPFAVEPSA